MQPTFKPVITRKTKKINKIINKEMEAKEINLSQDSKISPKQIRKLYKQ
jgi:hypothetical protein